VTRECRLHPRCLTLCFCVPFVSSVDIIIGCAAASLDFGRRTLLLLACFVPLTFSSAYCGLQVAKPLRFYPVCPVFALRYDDMRLPRGWREMLEPPASRPASPLEIAAERGIARQFSGRNPPLRPWDRLSLPPGWSELLAPPESLCLCGGRLHLQDPCPGIGVDSAAMFHHFIEQRCCPNIRVHCLGLLDSRCPHCSALFFKDEPMLCCKNGTVFAPLPMVPPPLRALIASSEVMRHIRVYNMALSMASTGHRNLSPGWGMFTLGGKTYHRLSANFCNPRGPPNFAQIYMLDTTAATARRLEALRSGGPCSGSSLQADVLAQLHRMLLEVNPWIQQFRTAGCNVAELVWHSCGSVPLDGMGLGAIVEGSGPRNVVIPVCQGDGVEDVVRNIPDDHHLYHPLAYVLLFPTGVGGWGSGMCRRNWDGSDAGTLTLSAWAQFIIQRREGGLTHLQSCGSLTCEFWCDVWAQVEARNLGFLRLQRTQANIRAGRFSSVVDCIQRNGPLVSEGTPVIMPALFLSRAL
jgi:hypothetical protein